MHEEEYKKDLEKRRKTASKEYFRTIKDLKKSRKKLIIEIVCVILFIIVVFKLTIGELLIPIPFVNYTKSRLYKVYFNDISFDTEVVDTHKMTIIPYFIYLIDGNHMTYQGDYDMHNYKVSSNNENYNIKVESYSCYAENLDDIGKIQVGCNQSYKNQVLNENKDTKYTMEIVKDYYTVVYKGEFQSDIKDYIDGKGHYYIEIIGKYSNVESMMYFTFDQE